MSSMSSRRPCCRGFTLVELLVVIGIIALLISILLPALNKAKQSAMQTKCAAHMRSIAQGFAVYQADYKDTYPAAYYYDGMVINSGGQSPDTAVNGYVHWSNFIYGKNGAGADAFICPTIERGGLPPTNTTADNRDAAQVNDDGNVVDKQAPRCAFTVNEAICPRNKFVVGFQGASTAYRFVKGGMVKRGANTILASEWNQDWRIVSDTGRADPGTTVCKSHRPVHGFKLPSGGELNAEKWRLGPGLRPDTYTRVKVADLNSDPQGGATFDTRLDWIGRNHGSNTTSVKKNSKKSNFLYCDGHVESKFIGETLEPDFQWGDRFYSLTNSDPVP